MTKRALVLGGTGLVGRYLVPELVQAGYTVDIISRTPRSPETGIRYLQADLAHPHWLSTLAIALADYHTIYHMAYTTHHDVATNRQVTLESLQTLVNALLPLASEAAPHLVYVGSMVIFDSRGREGTITENSPIYADSEYASNKLDAVNLLRQLPTNLRATVLHPTGVYDVTSPRILSYQSLLAHNYVPTSTPLGINNIVHAKDVAHALCSAAERQAGNTMEEYIINSESLTYHEWFAAVKATTQPSCWLRLPACFRRLCRGPIRSFLNYLGVECPIYFDPNVNSPIVQRFVYSSEKAARDLGFIPQVLFASCMSHKNYGQ